MRMAIVTNGKVVNVVSAAPGFRPPKGSIAVESEVASIGDNYDGESFISAEIKLQKAELIYQAKLEFDAMLHKGVEFDLAEPGEPPVIVRIPADGSTRADIAAIASTADPDKDVSLVTKDRVFTLTCDQIAKIHEAVMRHVADSHARLAKTIRDIESSEGE